MYHLRNKVYVELDSRAERLKPYVSFGKLIGYEFVKNEDGKLGEQLGYAVSLDDMEPKKFREAFEALFAQPDTAHVYADGKTYLRLYAMLIKALLPGVTFNVFRRIFLCRKATFNSLLVNFHRSIVNEVDGMVINDVTVRELYELDDIHQETFTELLTESPDDLSLEWRTLRLFTDDHMGDIQRSLRRLVHRTALANSQDCLDVLGRMITDDSTWEFLGCDADTLMNGVTVFEGVLNFPQLSNPIFLKPGLFDMVQHRDWYMRLLKESIQVLDYCGEKAVANCSRLILDMIEKDIDGYTPATLRGRLLELFAVENRLALPGIVAGKYDENLMRYVMAEDVDVWRQCLEGADW